MRMGIIGTGQIGGMLAAAFAKTNSLHLLIINRTISKATLLQQAFPTQIQVAESMEAIIRHCEVLFLCLKSSDTRGWLVEWSHLLRHGQLLLITSSQIPLAELENQTVSQVAKVVPSINQAALSGHLLYAMGPRTKAATQVELVRLLSHIGTPYLIDESQARIYADVTSCGPAFFATLMKLMAAAASNKGVSTQAAETLVLETLYGFVQLLKDNGFTLDEIIQKVSVSGGITEAGVLLLHQEAPSLFMHLFDATASRHEALNANTL